MPISAPNRIVIYAKDIQNITGKSERTARKIISEIRSKFNKSKNEFITIEDFSLHTGIKSDLIKEFMH